MRICDFVGCAKKHASRGYCQGHYVQLRAGKELTALNSVRRGVERHGTASMYQNHDCRCELCRVANNAYTAGRRSMATVNREHSELANSPSDGCPCADCKEARKVYNQQRLGIRHNIDYDAELEKRGGICDSCHRERVLVLDHDHITGVFRGFICNSCNSGIGNLGDTVDGVAAALKYLQG